jgi:hypothetical protein
MGTNMEALAAGNCFLRKSEQDSRLAQQYQSKVIPQSRGRG